LRLHPNISWSTGHDPLTSRLEQSREILGELMSLLIEILQRGEKHPLLVLDLVLACQSHNFLLERVSKMDEVSKVLPILTDQPIVVVNSTAFIASQDCTQLIVQDLNLDLLVGL
jgi:hypothetical protein